MRKITFTLLMVFIASLTFAQITFENPIDISASGDFNGTYSTITGDLDGDGDNDVIAIGLNSDNVLWYQNDGTGAFGTATTLTNSLNGATFSEVADIDGDGDNDIIATSWYSDGMMLFVNDGTGTFTQQTITDTITGGWEIRTADIDGDAVLDIIVSARNMNSVFWYKTTVDAGTGAITFAGNTIADGMDWVGGMDAGDIDGDGDIDVAVASLGYLGAFTDLRWYANDGSGNFILKQDDIYMPAVEQEQIESVSIKDFDNDGDNDLVFGLSASGGQSQIVWVKNSNGFGLFVPNSGENVYSSSGTFTSMQVADIDADNDLDVVFVMSMGNNPDIIGYIENSNNAVNLDYHLIKGVTGTTASWVNRIYTADLDGDNDEDILFTDFNNANASWIETNLNPVIYEQAIDIETCAGQDTLFGIKANLADSYQWQVDDGSGFAAITDGGVYSGATTDTLNITGITSDMDAYIYKCVVTNTNGTSESDTKTLTVSQIFSITSQPQNASLIVGDNASFTVVTDVTTNLTYQWRFNGANLSDGGTISGATTATLSITGVTVHEGGDYDCVITGICNNETSDVATLSVTTSINDIENNISIYPNPTTGQFTINNGNLTINNLEITNITGKTIYNTTMGHVPLQIDISNQPAGIYFIKIQTENGIIIKKIVKN